MKKLFGLGVAAVVISGLGVVAYGLYKRATEPDYLDDFIEEFDDEFEDDALEDEK